MSKNPSLVLKSNPVSTTGVANESFTQILKNKSNLDKMINNDSSPLGLSETIGSRTNPQRKIKE